MEKIIDDFINLKNNGLLIFNLPTGFGKTYKTLDYIYNNYKKITANNNKIYFITPLRKNLPFKEMKQRFQNDGQIEAFKTDVLEIKANVNEVSVNFDQVKIPEEYTTNRQYKELKSMIELKKLAPPEIESTIREREEPAFRRMLLEKINQKFEKKEVLKKAITQNQDFAWLRKLYPMIEFENKKIIFMSMKKLLTYNTIFYEKSRQYIELLKKGDLIFFDEFDYTKEVILDHLIENETKHYENYINLFRGVYKGLSTKPTNHFKASEKTWAKMVHNRYKNPYELYSYLKKIAKEKYNKHHFDYRMKYFNSDPLDRPFLFSDYKHYDVISSEKKSLIVTLDKEVNNNVIDFHLEKKGVYLNQIIYDISGFFTFFRKAIILFAKNYFIRIREEEQKEITIDSCINSFFNHIESSKSGDFEALRKEILIQNKNSSSYNNKKNFDHDKTDFFKTGFTYYTILNDENNSSYSTIQMLGISNSPENILVEVSKKAYVIGISATAKIKTSIGNYDLDYIQEALEEDFIEVTNTEHDRLTKEYEQLITGYRNISIHVEHSIKNIEADPVSQDYQEMENVLYDDKQPLIELAKRTEGKEGSSEFLFNRYLKVLQLWHRFILEDRIKAMICFLNKFPKENDRDFDESLLLKHFSMIAKNLNISENITSEYYFKLEGTDYENKAKKLKSALSMGEKKFIITTYSTLGVGQNLQHKISENSSPIPINHLRPRGEIDINAIYLERPTNLLVNIFTGPLSKEDQLKYIYQLEFLKHSGTISPAAFEEKLCDLFLKCKRRRTRVEETNLYQTEEFHNHSMKILIQAIGRICRAGEKEKDIFIFLDPALEKNISYFNKENHLFVPEFQKIIAATESQRKEAPYKKCCNKAELKTEKLSAFLNMYIQGIWDEAKISLWKKIREQAISFPTLMKEDYFKLDKTLKRLYIHLPEPNDHYYYHSFSDYYRNKISFIYNSSLKKLDIQKDNLNTLSKIKELSQQYKLNHYPLYIKKGDYILSPCAYNNIYKGITGEVCGQIVLEGMGYEPLELSAEEYEKFDFKMPNHVYIDFKLWNSDVRVPAKKEIEKIKKKLESVGGKKALIINIFDKADSDSQIYSTEDRIIEIPSLYKGTTLNLQSLTKIKEVLE